MPIKIATIDRQRSIRTLAKALYDVEGSPELQARAEAALARANPGLAVEGGMRKGVRVIVPSLRGAGAGEAARASGGETSLAAAVAADLEVFKAAADRQTSRAEKAATAAADGVSATAFHAAVKAARPELVDDLEGLAGDAKAHVDDVVRRGERLREALSRATADLGKLNGQGGR